VEVAQAPESTPMPQLGAVNEAGQWWDGESYQAPQTVGDFVFTGSEFQLRQGGGELEAIVFPPELITAIQEGQLNLADFAPITVDNTVLQAYDSEGTMWRILDVVYEGQRHTGAFREVFGEKVVVNTTEKNLENSTIETVVFGQRNQVEATDITHGRVLELEKVNYVGVYDGTSVTIPSFYVTFDYYRNGVRHELRTISYGGAVWSLNEEKPVSFTTVLENTRNRTSTHISLHNVISNTSSGYLDGIRDGADLVNPVIKNTLPLALIAIPPVDVVDNLDAANPGIVSAMYFR
jgi:hypothetical protein